DGIEHAFGQSFSTQFNIHRTRKGFPNNGLDNFPNMAKIGRHVTDRAVTDLLGGAVEEEAWVIPSS
ncbi:MAG: ADP-ribosylglycohydrolase family protein, partial [Henriciella sp.]